MPPSLLRLASLRLTLCLLLPAAAATAAPPMLVPTPRVVRWSTQPEVRLEASAVAILLGKSAEAPEEEGARLLHDFVKRRFDRDWPILREGAQLPAYRTLIVIGQRHTSLLLDETCRRESITLSSADPGHDGYLIQPVVHGDRLLVLVGGANARGALYGQDTLSQMLRLEGRNLTLALGEIRDAPAIPWRGRPQTMVSHYLRPGELDLYALSRVNFIDLRSGIYAYEPGEKVDQSLVREAVTQAHRRGLVVFATVNCGVPRAKYPEVLRTFRELLDLGADGLWLSFDDKGPGEDPVSLTSDVLRLGHERGISGRRLAITPPKGSYPKIVTEFNRRVMAVPGMPEALWFWTAVPSAEGLREAQEIGARSKPSWWHNWPRVFTGQNYIGIPPLSLGWSQPSYTALASAGEHVEAVMPWGGNAHGQHFVVPVFNLWAWNPGAHDWDALRTRISGLVFGEAQADQAVRFDNLLQELFTHYRYSYKDTKGLAPCPPRPRDQAAALKARILIEALRSTLQAIAEPSRAATLLPPSSLEKDYLGPMREAVELHARVLDLPFPEEWWPAVQRDILTEIHAGNESAVNRLLGLSRDRVLKEVSRIREELPHQAKIDAYVAWWQERASLDPAGWRRILADNERELVERIQDYGSRTETMQRLDALRAPPLEWGIGRWQVSNRLLDTALPAAKPVFWGDWLAGLHRQDGVEAVVFAARRKVPGEIGEYAELPLRMAVSDRRDRLALLLFVASSNKDLFSNTMIPYRWAGYRFIQILRGNQVLWEQDLGALPEQGAWCLARLPTLPDDLSTLDLRLRVEDRRVSLNNYTVCYLGPVRLLELPD